MASLSSPIGPTIDVVARTVSSSAISGGRGGALAVQPQANLINVERNLNIQTTQNVQQTQEISALRSTVDALRTETTTLNKGLATISNLIQKDSALEKQQADEEEDRERKLSETKIRMGKESQLEQRITDSLATPVQALQKKVTDIFGRIGEALTVLLAGWLTNQGIEALKANAEGNKNKLEEIKDNVLKTIGFSVAAIGAMKIGFDLVIKTITGITGKICGLILKLATAPLKGLRNILQAAPIIGPLLSSPKPGKGGGGGKPSISRNPIVRGLGAITNFAGKAFTAVGGVMDASSGQYTDSALAAGALLAPGALKVPFGLAYGADSIAEMFGGNIFGKNPNEPEKPEAKVSPTTPMMGNQNPTSPPPTIVGPAEADAKISSSTQTPTTPAVVEPQTPIIPQPSAEMTKNFQMAWDKRKSPFARGRIEYAWSNMTYEQQQQAKIWAKSTGKEWTEMKLIEKPSTFQVLPIPLAQVQPIPKPTQNVGELSEPAPNVIMMPSSQSNNQQSSISQAPTNGTDTPLISSSNPDNFYVLYSQLNYNVVI